jgi:hypothetical protein
MVLFGLVLAGGVVMTGQQAADPYRSVAEQYVKLVLAVGQHDSDYVDAFYGPAEWRKEAEAAKKPLATIDAQAAATEASLAAVTYQPNPRDAEMWTLRRQYLTRQLAALRSRVAMLQGKKLTFDEESLALYDAVAPTRPESEFEAVLTQLSARLPGEGSLIDRYDRYKQGFVIQKNRVGRVFQEAIRGCRERTSARIELPLSERFTVEYVTNKSWSGYNWYQGEFKSLIQVNTDLPIYIDRAIDLACHEGYPGHHVYNALLEEHLVKGRGWMEFTAYPLFTPQSLIAEGTANFGIEVAFPGEERIKFERATLFPLAGLDPSRAGEYYQTQGLVDELSYAGNEAARRYLDGKIDAAAATAWLERYALMPHDRAAQRIRFFDQYRSYVINYNYGKDLVRKFIESRGGTAAQPEKRWQEFVQLLSSPRLPSGLR